MKLIAFSLILSAAAIAGCAATIKPMTTPEGKQGFLVECDGSADSWASCYEAATKACQGKYNVIVATRAAPLQPMARWLGEI